MSANKNKQLGLINLIGISVVDIMVAQTDQHPLMDSAVTQTGIIGLRIRIQKDLSMLQIKINCYMIKNQHLL